MKKRFEFLSNDLGVDLGSSNVLINMDGKGIVVREPAVVAVDILTREQPSHTVDGDLRIPVYRWNV